MIYHNLNDLIGNTPVVGFEGIYIKLECFNPSGSVKDRAVKWMVEGLEKENKFNQPLKIIEATSGNTGISLAMIGALKGYEVILVMPKTMSIERRQMMAAYGAKLVLVDGGMEAAVKEARRLSEEYGYLMLKQFDNKNNVLAHEESTAKEILEDFKDLDYLVVGVGTGGTITGVSNILRKKYNDLKIIAVEPSESKILASLPNQGKHVSHGIQGIGAGFIPSILDANSFDRVISIATEEAKQEANRLATKGMFLGISAGAVIRAALNIRDEVGEGKKILAIAPDGGFKYLSTNTFFADNI